MILESLFYLNFHHYSNRLESKFPKRKIFALMSQKKRWTLFEKCMNTIQDIESYLSGWFLGTPIDDIKRENIKDFLAWAFFLKDYKKLLTNRRKDPLNHNILLEIEVMTKAIERKFRLKFSPGRNHKAKCMRLNFDPIGATHKPLFYYALIFALNRIVSLYYLHVLGMVRLEINCNTQNILGESGIMNPQSKRPRTRIPYWYRPPSSDASEYQSKNPLVFVHGIGVGLFSYFSFFRKLTRKTKRPIFVLELRNVSTSFYPFCSKEIENIPTHRETVDGIENFLDIHGYSKSQCSFIGHSLGSTVVTWIIKHKPFLINHAIFLDPVCFLLHYPNVAYNFVYRKPKSAVQLLLWWFASRELYVSWTLARCFYWYHNVLFVDEIPSHVKTEVVLGDNDTVVSSDLIKSYLMSNQWRDVKVQEIFKPEDFEIIKQADSGKFIDITRQINLYYFYGKNHAHFMVDKVMEDQILDIISSKAKSSSDIDMETRKFNIKRRSFIPKYGLLPRLNNTPQIDQNVNSVDKFVESKFQNLRRALSRRRPFQSLGRGKMVTGGAPRKQELLETFGEFQKVSG